MKKYELISETKVLFNRVTLYRIKALKNFGFVKAGELGGWVESEANLSQEGSAWLYGDAQVYGDAGVYGNAQVYGNARIYDNAQVFGDAWVYGDAELYNTILVYNEAKLSYGSYCRYEIEKLVITNLKSYQTSKVLGLI
jgi:hypothetical protein